MPAWFDNLLPVLYPERCAACGGETRGKNAFCPACLAELRPVPGCEPAQRPDRCRAVASAYFYEGALRRAVHAYKFDGRHRLARHFGGYLEEAFRRRFSAGELDGIVFVPTFGGEPGHALPLARELAGRVGLPLLPALRKLRETRRQHELTGAQRRENLRGAFCAGPEVAGKRLLLVDDVLTTGSTVEACAAALLEAGAAGVSVLTLAATRLKAEPVPAEKAGAARLDRPAFER